MKNINLIANISILILVMQLGLAIINPFEYYPLNFNVILFYFIYIFIFSLLVSSSKLYNYKFSINDKERIKKSFIDRRLTILIFLVFIFYLVFFYLGINYTLSNEISLQESRNRFFFGKIFGSDYEFGQISLLITIFQSLRLVLTIKVAKVFFVNSSFKNTLLYFALISTYLFEDIATGGRINVFYLLVILFTVYNLLPNDLISINSKKINSSILILILILIIIISLIRLEESHSLITFLYKYLVGPIFLFQYAINDPYGLIYLPELRFGVTFFSIDWIVVGVLNYLGIGDYRSLASIMDPVIATGYWFSSVDGANAFFTGFLAYYLDYGLFGAVFAGIIFSCLIIFFSKRLYKRYSDRNFILLSLILFSAILIFRDNNPLTGISFFFMLFFLLFIIK